MPPSHAVDAHKTAHRCRWKGRGWVIWLLYENIWGLIRLRSTFPCCVILLSVSGLYWSLVIGSSSCGGSMLLPVCARHFYCSFLACRQSFINHGCSTSASKAMLHLRIMACSLHGSVASLSWRHTRKVLGIELLDVRGHVYIHASFLPGLCRLLCCSLFAHPTRHSLHAT
jgi:hypothetical protein